MPKSLRLRQNSINWLDELKVKLIVLKYMYNYVHCVLNHIKQYTKKKKGGGEEWGRGGKEKEEIGKDTVHVQEREKRKEEEQEEEEEAEEE